MKRKAAIAALFCLLAAPLCFAWSFLTHETIIDMRGRRASSRYS